MILHKLRSGVIALLVMHGYFSTAAAVVSAINFDASRDTTPPFQIDTVTVTASPNNERSPLVTLCHQKLVEMGMALLASLPETTGGFSLRFALNLGVDESDEKAYVGRVNNDVAENHDTYDNTYDDLWDEILSQDMDMLNYDIDDDREWEWTQLFIHSYDDGITDWDALVDT